MHYRITILLLAISFISGYILHDLAGFIEYRPMTSGVVTKVIDGDTIIVNGDSIRLLGIDADERGYPCYKAAKQRLEELLLGKTVMLESDKEDKDIYGRYLRYVFLNGTNINLLLVKEGLAVARFTPKNTKYKVEILAAEMEARESGTGCKWKR